MDRQTTDSAGVLTGNGEESEWKQGLPDYRLGRCAGGKRRGQQGDPVEAGFARLPTRPVC